MAEVLARKIADGFHSKTVETTSKLKVGQQTASHENHRDGEAETTSYAQVLTIYIMTIALPKLTRTVLGTEYKAQGNMQHVTYF